MHGQRERPKSKRFTPYNSVSSTTDTPTPLTGGGNAMRAMVTGGRRYMSNPYGIPTTYFQQQQRPGPSYNQYDVKMAPMLPPTPLVGAGTSLYGQRSVWDLIALKNLEYYWLLSQMKNTVTNEQQMKSRMELLKYPPQEAAFFSNNNLPVMQPLLPPMPPMPIANNYMMMPQSNLQPGPQTEMPQCYAVSDFQAAPSQSFPEYEIVDYPGILDLSRRTNKADEQSQ